MGEYISSDRLCKLYDDCLYMIKQHGFYAFFVIRASGPSRGISIVQGGKIKKITKEADVQWLCSNFSTVLMKYANVMLPVRAAQDRLSREVKQLGFCGDIHGLIVDIDFYHHALFNPFDGSVTFYYAREVGRERAFHAFESLVKSVVLHSPLPVSSYRDIAGRFDAMCSRGGCFIQELFDEHQVRLPGAPASADSRAQVAACIVTEGGRDDGPGDDPIRAVSRRVAPLQRIFSGRVLRDFDIRLADTQPALCAGRCTIPDAIEFREVPQMLEA